MNITIRTFNWNDVAALVPLRAAVEAVDRLGFAATEDDLRKVLSRPTLEPEANYFVALADDAAVPSAQLVGSAWVVARNGQGESVFYLNGHVHPDWRRRGIGMQLLQTAIARARERIGEAASQTIWLQSEEVPDKAAGQIGLFESSGFEVARWELDMRRNLPGIGQIAPLVPIWQEPAGIQLRPWREGVDDEAVGWLLDAAFRDHWGYTAIVIQEWLQRLH